MFSEIERLNEALSGRYSIERELGEGGMSTVYLAQDLKHGRQVAMKVLLPELAYSIGPERFLREIEIASRLQHPHVLSLFDSGEADEYLFYTMPYVEGESLRDRLARGTLDTDEAIRITTEVASALTYAHDQGVIHRDVKPGNILLTRGHAIVADFGIAKAVEAAGGEGLTGTGFAVGTPAYMSPEQALGEKSIDGRSDVYALGCLLFEMVTGAPPFSGRMQAVVASHLSADPPSLRSTDPNIPVFFERAVEKALAKSVDDRFDTPDELADVLGSKTVVEVVSRPALDQAAYENYMRGRVHQERFTPEDFNRAQGYYEAVLETHPDHAPSHAGLALVLGSKVVLGLMPPLEAGPGWKGSSLRAVELDPELGEAHQALAQAYAWHEWDWERAEEEFLRALELDPNDVQGLIFYAHFLTMMRREGEAIEHARRAVEIDPLNQFLQSMYGMVLFMTRRIDEAVTQLEQCIETAPSNALARMGLSNCYAVTGETERLREAQAAYFSVIGDTQVAEALSGTDAEASPRIGLRRAADVLAERSKHMYVKTMSYAWLYDQAGEKELAVECLHRARELRDHEIAYLSVGPFSPEVHNHPEVLEMLRELKLPPPPPAPPMS